MERLNDSQKSVIGKVFDYIYKIIEFFCALCLAAQVVIIFYAVFGRYVTHKTPVWAEEISRLAMVWMAWLSAALAVKDETHVRITFLDKIFGDTGLKIRNCIYTLCNMVFCWLIFSKGLKLVEQGHRTRLPASGWPTSILYLSICVGGFAMFIMLLYKLGEQICHRK